jgi:Schlafen, AlbA_2
VTLDLYRSDLTAIPGTDLFSAIEAFCRISEPIVDRPQEDYRLDFKQEWKEDALRVVASFANTFGGILLVGVAEENGRPKDVLGVHSKSEIKTRIASSIASNISPTPTYEIAECGLPTDPARRVCLVRVRRGSNLYLLTTKGESNPVYIRNADESRPAWAAELRSLIEQRPGSSELESDLSSRLLEWQQFGVTRRLEAEGRTRRMGSFTYLKVAVLPVPPSALTLDQALEEELRRVVGTRYPGVSGILPSPVERADDRGRDWYEFRWLHTNLDYERRWRVNVRGEFGFATQVRYPLQNHGDFWSLTDVALGIISTLAAAGDWWQACSYFGDARLISWLDVRNLQLYQQKDYPGGFAPLFYNRSQWPQAQNWPMKPLNIPEYPFAEFEMTLPPSILTLSDAPCGSNAVAEIDLNYASLRGKDEIVEAIAPLLNQHIRSLGHVANLRTLREECAHLVTE